MFSFATIDDYNKRRMAKGKPPAEGQDAELAMTVLEDASAKIATELSASGIDYQRRARRDQAYATLLSQTACAMADRSMGSAMDGIKSRQQSAGPYSFTDSFANPMGDLYLLASERKSLGIGRARFGAMRPKIGGG